MRDAFWFHSVRAAREWPSTLQVLPSLAMLIQGSFGDVLLFGCAREARGFGAALRGGISGFHAFCMHFACGFHVFCVALGHLGPFGTILDHLGPFGPQGPFLPGDHFGPRTILAWAQFGLGTIGAQDNFGPGTIWAQSR